MDNIEMIDNSNHITLEYLIDCLYCNQEIELSINKLMYFISPDFEKHTAQTPYSIYNCASKEYVFAGTVTEILDYPFANGKTLIKNFDDFDILFIY